MQWQCASKEFLKIALGYNDICMTQGHEITLFRCLQSIKTCNLLLMCNYVIIPGRVP